MTIDEVGELVQDRLNQSQTPEQIAKALTEEVQTRKGTDDATIFVVINQP